MKKVLASSAIMVACTANFASAQTSVTIYGVFDQGFTYSTNQKGSANLQFTSLGVQGSRLGFKGSEDLGGGLKTIFTLESGFDPNTGALGQGGKLFGRQGFVGLQSTQWGTLTAGRQYDPLVGNLAPLTSNGGYTGLYFAHPFDNDNTNNTIRFNNAVKYASNTYGGFSSSVMYAFSNQIGAFGNDRAWSAGAKYENGPLKLGVGYLELDNGGASTTSPNPAGTAPDAPVTASRARMYGLGGSYQLGPALLGAVWTGSKYNNVGPTLTSGITNNFNNYELNARYLVAPTLMLVAAYTYTTVGISGRPGVVNSKFNQFSVLADYFLSKRTTLYAEGIYLRAGGDPFIAGANGGPAAQIQGLSASSTNSQALVRVGIRHSF
ncbi:porin [Glaciimonas sp. PCH181]|uniref:porin n=1 Tax=Glaciimonas sp. PCH181 TaxID=2133943 RepID=UPI000D38485C|nr:porin [Glaciimonas sp. PCH181]PUA18427.1 porin [Glaciimonas sp. PCH181]